MIDRQKIMPCLWFDFNAEEAVGHYLTIFKRSRIVQILHYGDAVPELKDKVLTILFELEGQQFLALNGGPQFPFTEAISLSVDCADQREVDALWKSLSAGGNEGRCGWLKDKFGVSWQIVPRRMMEMLSDADSERVARAMQAMMTMGKLDIAQLELAYR